MHWECEISEGYGLTGMDPFPQLLEMELAKLVTIRMYLSEK